MNAHAKNLFHIEETIKTDPDWESYGGVPVDFRLTYDGILPAASQSNNRAKAKHEIRKAFHPQLKRLWEIHPLLIGLRTDESSFNPELMIDGLANNFQRGAYKFVPLICERLKLNCKLSVLMLRPDPPGSPIIRSGDIDNRLKVLFDALRIPHGTDELPNDGPNEDEAPFFCLLEDDSMINHIEVETDVLLQDVNGRFDTNAVRLILSVTAKPHLATWENDGF